MAKKPKSAAPAQRYLLNPKTGRILILTEMLAERPDLVECDVNGVPLRPVARKLARHAELEAERQRQAAEALGVELVTETKDTFGKVRNPAAEPVPADNADLGGADDE